MKARTSKAVVNLVCLSAAAVLLLAAIAATTARIENRIERAPQAAVTVQGSLAEAAPASVRMPTVVIVGKRVS